MVDMLKFKDGSNIWFTSDHHFNDDRIRQFCSRRTILSFTLVISAWEVRQYGRRSENV